ncbi:MAG TPA: pyridoxamine 5'-phosphate oxidase family protein [Candidatus Saccharimonadia bacterium]|nr:pyridoxamine 5'-phosphate oxidase family protein [Candidatus Saccharimonadia bacterium]
MPDHTDITAYLRANPVAVLGTVGPDGTPHGAAVYVCFTAADQLYFVTKTETQKFRNLQQNPRVSITIVNSAANSTLQAGGQAHVVRDNAALIDLVMTKLAAIHAEAPDRLPPISKLRAGAYQMVGIKLDHVRLAQFKAQPIGGEGIFREG